MSHLNAKCGQSETIKSDKTGREITSGRSWIRKTLFAEGKKKRKEERKISDESLEKLLPFAESTQNQRAEFRAHLHRAAY